MHILKRCVVQLALHLLELSQTLVSRGRWPTLWENAQVVPVHQKKSQHDVGNYWLVSLLWNFDNGSTYCLLNDGLPCQTLSLKWEAFRTYEKTLSCWYSLDTIFYMETNTGWPPFQLCNSTWYCRSIWSFVALRTVRETTGERCQVVFASETIQMIICKLGENPLLNSLSMVKNYLKIHLRFQY